MWIRQIQNSKTLMLKIFKIPFWLVVLVLIKLLFFPPMPIRCVLIMFPRSFRHYDMIRQSFIDSRRENTRIRLFTSFYGGFTLHFYAVCDALLPNILIFMVQIAFIPRLIFLVSQCAFKHEHTIKSALIWAR